MSAVTAGVEEAGLDGFGGVLFADEDLQEAELGLDPLVLPVLLQVRHPVLLLHVPSIMLIKFFLKLSDGLPQFLLLGAGLPQLFQQLWHGRGVGAGQPQVEGQLPGPLLHLPPEGGVGRGVAPRLRPFRGGHQVHGHDDLGALHLPPALSLIHI